MVKAIEDLLTQNGCWYETFEHEEVRTSEEAAKLRTGYTIKQGAKALIVKIKQPGGIKKFVMVVIPGDKRFDNVKSKDVLQAKEIRFATEEEVIEITNGVRPGGVPPFGNLFGLEVYVDPSLLQNEKIVFNAGDRRFSIGIKSQDYKKLVDPKIVEIV